jgi:hypothetical protein
MQCNRRRFALASAGVVAAAYGGRFTGVSAQDTVPLILFGDTVQSGKNVPEDQLEAKDCVLNNRFPRNSQIVWRVRVVDPMTGQAMDDTGLDKVEVTLGDGTVIALEYGGHPPQQNREFYWAGAWLVPKDYPTGTLPYTVAATAKDGRTGQYKPFDIPTSMLTITDEVLQDIAEEEEEAATPAP